METILKNKLFRYFGEQRIFILLSFLFLVSTLVVFKYSFGVVQPDELGYVALANCINYGCFCQWCTINVFTPELWRTPLYPLIIFVFLKLFGSLSILKWFQLLIFFISVGLILKVLYEKTGRLKALNIFLIILIPSIHMGFYTGAILAETFNLFFIVLLFYCLRTNVNYVTLFYASILSALIFLLRPAFLYFPLFIIILSLLFKRQFIYKSLFFAATFYLLLIPFGLFNKYQYNYFTFTPAESGGIVLFLGYWQHKLPGTHGVYMGDGLVNFSNSETFESDVNNYYEQLRLSEYEASKELSDKDRMNLKRAKDSNQDSLIAQFAPYSVKYAIKKNEVLKSITISNIKQNFSYYFLSRVFNAYRLIVSGIPLKKINSSDSFFQKVKLLAPFFTTFYMLTFCLFLIFRSISNFRNLSMTDYLALIIFSYYLIIHLPVAAHSRYTIPVHLLFIYFGSISYFRYLEKSQNEKQLIY